jgi:MFS family permease
MTDREQPEESLSLASTVTESLKELSATAVAFVKAPKALWGINIPYVIEGLVYFGILTILGKYCSENVTLSDLHAGWVYSAVTAGITLAMLFLGGVCDKIGVPRALALAFFMFVIGRILVAFSGTVPLGHGMGSAMFLVMALGLVITAAAMGYAVVYGLMNLGAFFSGFISPMVRHRFVEVFPPNGLTAVFWVYAGLCVIALIITLVVLTNRADTEAVERVARETAELEAQGGKPTTKEEPAATHQEGPKVNHLPFILISSAAAISLVAAFAAAQNKIQVNPWITYLALAVFGAWSISEFMRVRPAHPFRDARFVFFIFILIPVQTLFAHVWLTVPYYLDRAFRGSVVSEYFEFFSNINPILIFILAPLVAGLTARANVYTMMIIGTFVMAAPAFLLTLGPHVGTFLVYVLLISIGEAMWQPRFLQWIAEVAPPGKTGIYMGIGQFPWFLTKFLTGLYSGYFVGRYIPKPETGLAMNTEFLWLVYASVAMISPVALVLARKWMKAGMKERHGD